MTVPPEMHRVGALFNRESTKMHPHAHLGTRWLRNFVCGHIITENDRTPVDRRNEFLPLLKHQGRDRRNVVGRLGRSP